MKKIKFTFIALVLVLIAMLAIPAQAQAFKSQSFLNVQSVQLTNTINPTNLFTTTTVGTNWPGLKFTNQNTAVEISATNRAVNRVNPFKDVDLWALRDGSWPVMQISTNGLLNFHPSYANISVGVVGGSGANTAIPISIVPIWNGDERNAREATAAGDEWRFAVTPNGATAVQISTNVPLFRWLGAKGLRVRWAVNSDADASSAVTLYDLSLNGFVP